MPSFLYNMRLQIFTNVRWFSWYGAVDKLKILIFVTGRRKTPRVWDVCIKVDFKIKDNDEIRTETARSGSLFKTCVKHNII